MEPHRDPMDDDEPAVDGADDSLDATADEADVLPVTPDELPLADVPLGELNPGVDGADDAAPEMAEGADAPAAALEIPLDDELTQAMAAARAAAESARDGRAIQLPLPDDLEVRAARASSLIDVAGDYPSTGSASAAAGDAAARDIPQSTKRPGELIRYDFGPRAPVVFVDPETMQQVRPTPTDDDLPPELRRHPLRVPPSPDDSHEPNLNVGMSRPVLVVTMHGADRHFQSAFEAQAERWVRLMRDMADDRVAAERERQAAEERAIFGDY